MDKQLTKEAILSYAALSEKLDDKIDGILSIIHKHELYKSTPQSETARRLSCESIQYFNVEKNVMGVQAYNGWGDTRFIRLPLHLLWSDENTIQQWIDDAVQLRDREWADGKPFDISRFNQSLNYE